MTASARSAITGSAGGDHEIEGKTRAEGCHLSGDLVLGRLAGAEVTGHLDVIATPPPADETGKCTDDSEPPQPSATELANTSTSVRAQPPCAELP